MSDPEVILVQVVETVLERDVITETVTVHDLPGASVPEILEVGIQGPPGASPEGADLHYVHLQGTPSDEWIITHNLGKYPAVHVEDSTGEQCIGTIEFLSFNQLSITFSAAFSGRAILN